MNKPQDRPPYGAALAQSGVLERLAAFDPHIAGTPPLGLDLPSSDIDILCHAPNPSQFDDGVWRALADCPGFAIWQWRDEDRPVVARFHCAGWVFELFGQALPVIEQAGWRHFQIERRLLALGGAAFRDAVLALRRAGAKTEPAVAELFGLAGEPYATLLTLEPLDDAALGQRIRHAIR
ncbi:DUF4269 domain-containing protein [Sphingomonas sp. R1]|uniref:DUF4269 domain-containing protein n=1 Tax=Sphingomonas sp. R1 TaxID=399176 RepID=UPI0022241800|nr:DUF4269 domain-containing protein [Sphingomonas sp. R1]UYY76237.1 DUF4269 domain-containing protein [Sphingomonas sp. R1]